MRRFDEHRVALLQKRGKRRDERRAAFEPLRVHAVFPRGTVDLSGKFAARQHEIDARLGALFADARVERLCVFAELEHVAQDDDTPPRRPAKRIDRRADGAGIGVIAIVNDRQIVGLDDARAAADGLIAFDAATDLVGRKPERVADGGRPLPGAAVRFELANMAELYPISEKITDARGEAKLETGCSTLRIHATDGNRWLARTTDAERVEIDLKDGFSCEGKNAAETLQMQKNRGNENDGTVCGGADAQAGEARERCAARSESEALREEAAGRGDEQNAPASRMASRECCAARCESEALRFADEKLRADVSSEALQKRDAAAWENGDAAEDVLPPIERFVQRPPRETRIQPTVHSEAAARRHAETLRRCERMRAARSAELASDDADLARARGNAGEIRAFVSDARFAQADKRALLSTLREKDLADTSAETLMDALETARPVKTALPEAIWREAVLCPRIADEKLLPVRRALRHALGEGLCPSDEAARVDGESTAGIP